MLLEVGRDVPETRMFSVSPVRSGRDAAPWLAVAGFTSNGRSDMADLAVYEISDAGAVLQWRLLRGGAEPSSLRTLRSADLDGDDCEELVALGRIGHEELDSRAELQVFDYDGRQWRPAALERWQSGQYTHGYGMEIGDVDGDGRSEIVAGGFFRRDEREWAELRVWRFAAGGLSLVASTAWGAETGHTRINSVRIGDVTGNGGMQIITAGRTGQVPQEHAVNLQEADQLIVWSLKDSQLVQVANCTGELDARSRFRELRLADLDGAPGLELLAGGREETAPPRGRGRGDGSGGGRGDGSGGGRARRAQEAVMRPLFSVFRFENERLSRVSAADFGDAAGEVRDLAVVRDATGATKLVTITADDLKPQRNAALDQWEWNGTSLVHLERRTAALGDETRARQLIAWGPAADARILTIGFVHRGDQVLGQILDWGRLGASAPQPE